MLKNNLRSLMIHFLISFLNYIVFMIFHMSVVKWASEESARRHQIFMIIIALIVIGVSLLMYYFLSRAYCIPGKGTLYNIASVGGVALIGMLLWLRAFSLEPVVGGASLFNSSLWVNYGVYNHYSMFFLYEVSIKNPYNVLLFSFLPSIAMYFGMKRRVIEASC
jgi:hypothetical protein